MEVGAGVWAGGSGETGSTTNWCGDSSFGLGSGASSVAQDGAKRQVFVEEGREGRVKDDGGGEKLGFWGA